MALARLEPPEELLEPTAVGAQESWRVGRRIHSCDAPALLLDVLLPGSPIVGASRGFHKLTGRDVVGSSWEALLEGADENRVSRSMVQDVESFLRCSRLCQLCSMADAQVVHVLKRADGFVAQYRSCFRLVKVQMSKGEEHRFVLCLLQDGLEAEESLKEAGVKLAELCQELHVVWPNPMFFPAPLSNKCILLSGMSSAMRRESHLPRGCVALSNGEIKKARDGSYFFKVMVDGTTKMWSSRLPFLGFTTTTPGEVQEQRFFFGALPHAFCLGQSALVGGAGEAWLRSGEHKMPKLRESVETGAERCLLSSVPEHRRVVPFVPRVGDQLGCQYRSEEPSGSQLSLSLNGTVAFEFHFRAALPSKPLYAVVDVCHCVNQVTLMADDRLMGS